MHIFRSACNHMPCVTNSSCVSSWEQYRKESSYHATEESWLDGQIPGADRHFSLLFRR